MPYFWFVLSAYLVTGAVIAGLIAWVLADARAQRRALAEMEGLARREEDIP